MEMGERETGDEGWHGLDVEYPLMFIYWKFGPSVVGVLNRQGLVGAL